MPDLKDKRIWFFLISTSLFSLFSFVLRNILIANYNNWDFKFISIDYVKNYGAAFSLLHTHTSLLIIVSILIFLFVLIYIFRNIKNFSKSDVLFSSLLTSGILCNLTERLMDGFVTDYIRLNFIVFPIFNISDVFINIGAFILICNILFNNEPEKN